MKTITILSLILFLLADVASAAITVNFTELSGYNGNASNGTGSYYNGDAASSGWTSGGAFFGNTYSVDLTYGDFWSGWSYSNVNDANTSGFGNQFASATGTGIGGGGNYALANGNGAYFNLPTNQQIDSLYISNTTYAYLSMKNGDSYAKAFGGVSGNDPDYFTVTFNGYNELGAAGSSTGSVEFYLADYRYTDNSLDYIIKDWRLVDLSGLGNARSVSLTFGGSDMGGFGLNTPAYAAFDNIKLTAVPEPNSFALIGCVAIALTLRRSRR